MFPERSWPGQRQLTETNANKEKFALDLMKMIQLFPYDTSTKNRGETLAERTQQTKKLRRGACTAKHELLATDLNELGYSILFLTYPFLWSNLLVDYPKEVIELAKQMPVQYHLALGLLANNNMELIDVTWDPQLQKAGFPVGKISQQITSMPMAVIPENAPIIHFSAEDRAGYIERVKSAIPWTQVIPGFYGKLNSWLESVRLR